MKIGHREHTKNILIYHNAQDKTTKASWGKKNILYSILGLVIKYILQYLPCKCNKDFFHGNKENNGTTT